MNAMRKSSFFTRMALPAAVYLALAGCGGGSGGSGGSGAAADSVFKSGKVVTVDGQSSIAQAFAVRSGRFIAIGSNAEMDAYIGAGTKVVDLGGRTVVPGLSDAHMHNEGGGPGIDLSQVRTMAQLLAAVAEAAKKVKPGEVLLGNGDWHEAQLVEQRLPLATELETAAPGIPVVVIRGGHDYILNTTALNKWGISKTTPVPPGGAITKDANGELTGELVDSAKALVTLPPPPAVTIEDVLRTQKKLNAHGLVNVRVPGFYRAEMVSDYKLLKQMRDAKQLTLRYSVLLSGFDADLAGFQQKVAAAGIKPLEGDAYLSIWGVKTGVDGGFEGAHMSKPYQEPYGKGGTFSGITTVAPDKYNAFISGVHKMGFRIASHAVGDAAVDQVLDAYERANSEASIVGKGWAIEHAFVSRPDQYPRIKKLDLALSVQDHLYLVAPVLKNYWGADRASQVTPVKAYVDQGFLLAGGTDSPVIPVNPFWAMYHFLTRDTISAGVYGANQGVPDRGQVLRMFTLNYAKLIGEEASKGSIEKGKLADFVVLSADYLTIPDKQVEGLKALATYVEGKSVYQDPAVAF
ncbi:MAG TPA: amidohydrolase [Burkholderiaceae bacterium]|nr:amidohydrolase [Burkholderiaceae bacterium]